MGIASKGLLRVVLLLLLSGGLLHAKEATPSATAFDKSLRRMDGYLERRSFAKGLREIKKLLEQHGEQDYVRARRAELEDYVRRFAFGNQYPAPCAADVLRGRVKSYDPDTGKLEVEYSRADSADFRRLSNGTTQFFADTMGPFTLQVWASRMPSRSGSQAWMEFYGGEHPKTKRGQFWHVYFGSPDKMVGAKTVYRPAIIQHIDGKKRKTVSTSHGIPGKVGKPYVVQINVGHTSIQAGTNHKIVGKARKLKGQWGWIRFAVPGWTRLKFKGHIEPAYIQARLDAILQIQLKDFRKRFKRDDHLPAWLFERSKSTPVTSRKDLPVDVDKKHYGHVRALQRSMRAGAWAEARKQLEALQSEGVPDAVLRFFSARIHLGEDAHAEGLADIDAVLASAPDFLEGMLLRGRLLGHLRRADDAMSAFHKSVSLAKEDPGIYEGAILSLLLAGRPDAAQKFVELAASNQVDSPGLDVLARTVVKTRKGPSWSRVYEYKTRNYHVFSDISKGTCVKAAKLLEDALTCYRVHFRWTSHEKGKVFPVYLFSGKWGLDRYIADLQAIYGNPHRQMLGMYSPLTKQLLIWNQPDQKGMFETIRHEGFHQYLDSFAASMPRWLNEGLAVYHEIMTRKRGRLETGALHPGAFAALKRHKWVPLSTFVAEPPGAFYGRGYASYAQAWIVVHLLMEGKGRWRVLRKAIVEDLGKLSASELLEKHFTPDVVEALDAAARAHRNKVAKLR